MAAPRQRLVEAMATVASRHGYGEASVARVVKQAGMSRATFYEHFEDRDDCFLAAFQQSAEPVREELSRTDGRTALASRPREAIELLLTVADAHPAAARLVLIEAMAGDARVRAAHEELLDETEVVLDRYLDAAAEQLPPLEIPVRALLGGIANLVGMRVFRQEGSLADLGEDLLAWLESYALPRGRRRLHQSEWQELGRAWAALEHEPPSPPSPGAKRLSRGRGRPASDVAGEQRERVIDAIARCTCEKGYAATTVADLVAAAGITRGAFYEQFRNKEDAFLAAQAHGLQGGAAAAAERFFRKASWRERIWSGSAGLLEYLAKRPDLAHMQLIESYGVGPKAIRRSFESRMAFTVFLEEGYRQRPEAERLPRLSSEVIAGATEELFRRQAARGRTELDRELLPQAAYLALAPFIGAEAALDFVRERCRTAA